MYKKIKHLCVIPNGDVYCDCIMFLLDKHQVISMGIG